ncbi:MAG TPA: N-acetyl-gamma-glutamyl-phosphate reductase [Acidimicrobiales bacterium]|nr:N-acetyl-gamma-glutamyl-phosphate reductase [Acidimicrobiales bacterium]
MFRVGVVGASGYAGAELLRLCHAHPDLELAWATGDTQAGTLVGGLYPSLAAAYPGLAFQSFEPAMAADVDLVFLALPHGASQRVMPEVLAAGPKVVDLGADFRLRNPAIYERWYGEAHVAAELLERFAYGLPELHRDEIAKADAVASAGCYPTAAALALAPLTDAGLVETTNIVVDAASGVSGAGRTLKHATHFGTANEDFTAYGLLDHRHTPEMEQSVGATVLFTPHLAPMTRGILATCYARPAAATSIDPNEVLGLLEDAYADEPFVVVSPTSPSTKATWGSNAVHLTARYDQRTGWILVLAALDNLVKGASGQAVQCANILLGVAETAGLSPIGVYP